MNKQLFTQTAPPPLRGRGRGCGAERRQWRMQRGGAPAAVEKIEQASSAKIFSGTARRWGQMRPRLPWERICAQYGRCFASSVSSTASDRKGLVKGESVPLDRVLPTFARTKVGPRREGVLTTPLQKAPRRRQAKGNFGIICVINPSGSLRSPPPFTQGRLWDGAAPAGANEALTTIYFFFIISESPGQNIPIE